MKTASIDAGVLNVTYRAYGPTDGWPCIMAHGFPYDVHAYAEAAPILAEAGARVILPYLRGYGPTRFLSDDTPRSGEQAALGADLLALMDALEIEQATLGGYDWGGRACCVVSALWPERVTALVSGNGYNLFNHARSWEPASPEEEAAFWYQYYFHSERGRRGLAKNRHGIAKLLWKMWSPSWGFDDTTFGRTVSALDNPDFVDVVIHSYRHRYGLVPGDPAFAHIDTQLTAQPVISVPTISIDGDDNGVHRPGEARPDRFTGAYSYRHWPNAGHNLPQEKPQDWAAAILEARDMARSR
ncbi:MAG: alpha/beta hydrolase [Pseudomonadota bacterium]